MRFRCYQQQAAFLVHQISNHLIKILCVKEIELFTVDHFKNLHFFVLGQFSKQKIRANYQNERVERFPSLKNLKNEENYFLFSKTTKIEKQANLKRKK